MLGPVRLIQYWKEVFERHEKDSSIGSRVVCCNIWISWVSSEVELFMSDSQNAFDDPLKTDFVLQVLGLNLNGAAS